MIRILIFQVFLGRIATTISIEYIEAKFCPLSNKLRRTQIIVALIQSVDAIVAVLAIIRFERHMKDALKGHHALLKLVMFKGITFIDWSKPVYFTFWLPLMPSHQLLMSPTSTSLSALRHS